MFLPYVLINVPGQAGNHDDVIALEFGRVYPQMSREIQAQEVHLVSEQGKRRSLDFNSLPGIVKESRRCPEHIRQRVEVGERERPGEFIPGKEVADAFVVRQSGRDELKRDGSYRQQKNPGDEVAPNLASPFSSRITGSSEAER